MEEITVTENINNVMDFNFNGHPIHSIMIDNEPWFIGKEIANALEYKRLEKAIQDHVEEDDRIMLNSKTQPQIRTEFDYKKLGQRGGWIINESGLYSLILSSKTENSKRFKHWVTSEALPSIRKTGGYMYRQQELSPDQLLSMALVTANNIIEEQKKAIGKLEEDNFENSIFVELMTGLKENYLVTEIASYYGMNAFSFNRMLKSMKVQTKIDGVWELTSDYQNKGYTKVVTKTYKNKNGEVTDKKNFTVWTKLGIKFLYYKLKENGILPGIELDAIKNMES